MLVDITGSSPSSAPTQNIQPTRSSRPGQRRGNHLTACHTALGQWVKTCWKQNYLYCIWGPNILLPDKVLTKLASLARIQTLDDLKQEIPEWAFSDKWGADVLRLLAKIDDDEKQEKERVLAAKKSAKKEESERKKALRTEERREELYQARQQKKAMGKNNGSPSQYHVLQTVPQTPSNISSLPMYSTFPVSVSPVYHPPIPGPSQSYPVTYVHVPYYPMPVYAHPSQLQRPATDVHTPSTLSTVPSTYPHFPNSNPLP
ncbi:hypothetical protein CERSUDRAFT_95684 [Gelatoporia subvermispora B]|uniref:Uncharacterized protein n=1 Tax=Ceriporiopsis subvermispora (strain B) TaxID=914234 RepID=M2RC47_CERS8|nr:hypothetical protein CERSUDRAFT_95684 [Gelatoporia subvermispora B]